MGDVIAFPSKHDNTMTASATLPIRYGPVLSANNSLPPSSESSAKSDQIPQKTSAALVQAPFDSEEEEAFMDLLREWPCFAQLQKNTCLQELLDHYYLDELQLDQDCVIEFMLHMRDPGSPFDIGNALYTWEELDRQFFMLSLSMHAELIDQMKQEEMNGVES